jgi:hypothetical protein
MYFYAARIFAILSLCPLLAFGAEVRASFLQDTNSLRQTIEFLIKSGCTKQGTTVFEHAVHRYFEESFDLDLSKFPQPVGGFYQFASLSDLIPLVTNQLPRTEHSSDFSCVDAVIALADGHLRTALHPDQVVGAILVTAPYTNSELGLTNAQAMRFAATPRDAFNLVRSSFPEEGRDPLFPIFPEAMRDSRICLEPLLLRWYPIPASGGEDHLETNILKVLQSTWQQETLKFPNRFEVVLFHIADPVDHTLRTFHAALLFRHKNGCTYIEKAGTNGPFVRIDVAATSDIAPWLRMPFNDYTDTRFRHFATFNDRKIQKIP